MSPVSTAPFGSWPSPIGPDAATAFGVRVGEVIADGGAVWFALPLPEEGGRVAIFSTRDGVVEEKSPPGANVRTRVHEYGGGAWWVSAGVLWWVEAADQQLRRLDTNDPAAAIVTLTSPSAPAASTRYADFRPDNDDRFVVAVREVHDGRDERSSVRNDLVAIANDGTASVQVLASGADFYSSPRLSPDGRLLAWIQWDQPAMPWDRTELWVADYSRGAVWSPRRLLGGDGVPVAPQQPTWGPDNSLFVIADLDEWWNLYQFGADHLDGEGPPRAVVEGAFEIGIPPWVFNRPRFAVTESAIYYASNAHGSDQLVALTASGETAVDDFWGIGSLSPTDDGGVVFIGSGPSSSPIIAEWNPLVEAEPSIAWTGPALPFAADFFPAPESITFETTDGAVAHGFWYPPANPEWKGPDKELPPLLVQAHGGPTGDSPRDARVAIRYWTSRGIGVVDVMYRGSTGYGRAYREALYGGWGIVDVDDCLAAAQHLVARGEVDPARMAIAGSSAGGFTVLAALQRGDRLSAGAIRFGVTDLCALNEETHKFEASYNDALIAPWPSERAVYEARSPINGLERITRPVLVQQGGEDRVVPPSQAEALIAGLDAQKTPWAYTFFPDEGHGFRAAETIIAAAETELAFFSTIWGVVPSDKPTPPTIHHFTP